MRSAVSYSSSTAENAQRENTSKAYSPEFTVYSYIK